MSHKGRVLEKMLRAKTVWNNWSRFWEVNKPDMDKALPTFPADQVPKSGTSKKDNGSVISLHHFVFTPSLEWRTTTDKIICLFVLSFQENLLYCAIVVIHKMAGAIWGIFFLAYSIVSTVVYKPAFLVYVSCVYTFLGCCTAIFSVSILPCWLALKENISNLCGRYVLTLAGFNSGY